MRSGYRDRCGGQYETSRILLRWDLEPQNAESDDKSRQLATVVVPATIQAFFVTDLYAKDSGYVSQVKRARAGRSGYAGTAQSEGRHKSNLARWVVLQT